MRTWMMTVTLMLGLTPMPLAAQASDESAGVAAVVSGFHAALKAGDAAAVMKLLAPDVQLLETGGIETRAEYETNHLPVDIEFEKVVASTREPSRIVVAGNVAWAITASTYKGTFQNKAIDSIGVELMVLSRDAAAGWQIRAIHWSGRARRPQQ